MPFGVFEVFDLTSGWKLYCCMSSKSYFQGFQILSLFSQWNVSRRFCYNSRDVMPKEAVRKDGNKPWSGWKKRNLPRVPLLGLGNPPAQQMPLLLWCLSERVESDKSLPLPSANLLQSGELERESEKELFKTAVHEEVQAVANWETMYRQRTWFGRGHLIPLCSLESVWQFRQFLKSFSV